MSAYQTYTSRAFCRSTDRAVLGGVCAGIADHFGFNLRVLRILAIIAFFVAMPMAVIAYLAVVFLFPARPGNNNEQGCWRHRRRARKRERRKARKEAREEEPAAPNEVASAVRARCQSMDKRLADLEKYITSPRYQLDREIRNL